MQSMSQFLGRRELQRSWLIFYCVRPLVGSLLALIVYFVLRMGVLSPGQSTGPSSINVYGVLAFAALSGMFSRQAVDKLAEIFETIFKKTHDDIASSDAGSLFRNPARADVAARLPRTNASESGATFQSEERVNDPDNR